MLDATARAETWLPVPGYEGSYEVSDHGRVRSLPRIIVRQDGIKMRVRGGPLTPGRQSEDDGHLRVTLSRGGAFKCHAVHILMLTAFVGPRPDGMVGCHWNDDPADNRLSNLRWATVPENVDDMNRNGHNGWQKRQCCPRGHDLVVPNLMPARLERGHRICLACSRAFSDRQRAARQGQTIDFQAVSDAHYAAIMRAAAA